MRRFLSGTPHRQILLPMRRPSPLRLKSERKKGDEIVKKNMYNNSGKKRVA
jgi:hypothetical protein